MANTYSNLNGPNTAASSVSLNDTRRKFNFGERVAELAPQQSPFFVYLSKVAKKATNDPVFKFLEQRHQWQRRNVVNVDVKTSLDPDGSITGLAVNCDYDKFGRVLADQQPNFLLPNQILAIQATDDADNSNVVIRFKITAVDLTTDTAEANLTGTVMAVDGVDLANKASWPAACTIAVGAKAQVIGTTFGEGTGNPNGWEDKLYDREGYCQIFKTGMNIFSGTSLATEYRGIANEYQRIWQDKLMEHKMDLEQAFLFGVGSPSAAEALATEPSRQTWGILPYTEANGKIYNMSYASSGYDAFLDAMEDFFALEGGNSGNKLVLASRKVITYLNKLGAGSFMNNSVGSSQYRLDVQNVPGAFGHQVTMVNTIFGNLHFIQEPLLRGMWEDYCVMVDMANVAYRPLAGNGISRDTFIETNVQDNGIDGRQDQIITEAGLEISLPETHAIIKFS